MSKEIHFDGWYIRDPPIRIGRKEEQIRMRTLTAIIGMATALVASGSQTHDSRWFGDGRIFSGLKIDAKRLRELSRQNRPR